MTGSVLAVETLRRTGASETCTTGSSEASGCFSNEEQQTICDPILL